VNDLRVAAATKVVHMDIAITFGMIPIRSNGFVSIC
jgi:hypothetical protein